MTQSQKPPFVNKYSLMARVYPALITLIPWFVLSLGFAGSEMADLVNHILSLQVLGCVTMNVAAFFLLTQVNRFIGKEVFESLIFQDELQMPTTTMLLASSNQTSPELLAKLSVQIKTDFGLALPTLEEAQQDEAQVRRRIVEIVGQIRSKVRDGHLLLQHNIEYGFARNLIGGAPLAFAASVISALYYHGKSVPAAILSAVLIGVWLILLAVSRSVIQRFGRLYAKRLIQEYSSGEAK